MRRVQPEEVAERPMVDLPNGVQKLLDLVRAVASETALMLLDEPTSGTAVRRSARNFTVPSQGDTNRPPRFSSTTTLTSWLSTATKYW
jgi:ABC-type Na+ transport system ATPase subunit NatA